MWRGNLMMPGRVHFRVVATSLGHGAFLPMQDPGRRRKLRRCVKELGFVGGHIATNVHGVYLHDPQFNPVFHAALDLDVPALSSIRLILPARSACKNTLIAVAGYLLIAPSISLKMVCSGFLDTRPKLKLVCAHTGAFSLALRARMQREVDTNPQIAPGLRCADRRLPSSAVLRYYLF